MFLIVSLRESLSALASVMMPSPLNWVSAKIFSLSEVSAREILSFSSLRLARICLADFSSFAPSSFLVLKSLNFRKSCPLRRRSGFLIIDVIHCDAAITSSTWMRPSPSASRSFRVLASNSSPVVGQLSTVHFFLSRFARFAMSEPFSRFTRTEPPTEAYFQL